MSNNLERYNPFDKIYGDDLNHIIDAIDAVRYNVVSLATAASGARYVLDPISFRAYDNTLHNYGAPSGPGVTFEVSPNGSVFAGGGLTLQSSLSGARWVIDQTSIRGYDGTATDYGAPSGAGVSFEAGNVGGNLFLGGGNLTLQSAASGPLIQLIGSTPLLRVSDGTRDRWSAGNLLSYTDPRGAVSAAGYGSRVLDASGNLIWDAAQTLHYFPVYTGYTPVDASNPATARFQITSDVVKVLRVTVSYYTDTFKVGQQSTGSASLHSHTWIGHRDTVTDLNVGLNASGQLTASAQPFGFQTATEFPSAAQNSLPTGIEIQGSGHTHSLTSPSNLFATGGASGIHVKVFNQTGTLLADHNQGTGAGVFISDLDITADSTWAPGFYQIQLTSATIGGIEAQINIKATVQGG